MMRLISSQVLMLVLLLVVQFSPTHAADGVEDEGEKVGVDPTEEGGTTGEPKEENDLTDSPTSPTPNSAGVDPVGGEGENPTPSLDSPLSPPPSGVDDNGSDTDGLTTDEGSLSSSPPLSPSPSELSDGTELSDNSEPPMSPTPETHKEYLKKNINSPFAEIKHVADIDELEPKKAKIHAEKLKAKTYLSEHKVANDEKISKMGHKNAKAHAYLAKHAEDKHGILAAMKIKGKIADLKGKKAVKHAAEHAVKHYLHEHIKDAHFEGKLTKDAINKLTHEQAKQHVNEHKAKNKLLNHAQKLGLKPDAIHKLSHNQVLDHLKTLPNDKKGKRATTKAGKKP